MKRPAVYILTNRPNGVLYVGVTSNLIARVWQHREKQIEGFSSRYNLITLVWFECHETMESAILREKQLKAGSRARKCALIEGSNFNWLDLWPEIVGDGG
jgi:putative endonuclease